MPLDHTGAWIPNLFTKQWDVFNATERYVLISGPRKSGKTIAALNKVVRHLWTVSAARVALFSKYMKSAKDGGIWTDLTKIVLPEWFEAGIGMEYTSRDGNGNPGPKMDNLTKTISFTVRNVYGGESELMLFSLDHDDDVEAKVRQQRFSMIYFAELGNFYDRKVFAVTVPQLRIPNPHAQPATRPQDLQWIADCNPTDQGDLSWIYRHWYIERVMENHPKPNYQRNIRLIEIFCADNPYLTQDDNDEIYALCMHDPELFERYVNGRWIAGGNKERHFASCWKPSIHVLGNISVPDADQWEVLQPTPNCVELVAGWDIGDTNHSAHILEPINTPGQPTIFSVLDELVKINAKVSVEDFVIEFMNLMDQCEQAIGRQVIWRHWSDPDAMKQFQASINGFNATLVHNTSGGRITLQGVPKEPHSVERRVSLLKRLLIQQRLFISAQLFKTQEMFRELRKGKAASDFVQRTNNPQKHPFDSLSYALMMECLLELESSAPSISRRTGLIQAA